MPNGGPVIPQASVPCCFLDFMLPKEVRLGVCQLDEQTLYLGLDVTAGRFLVYGRSKPIWCRAAYSSRPTH